jgi:hypothetical protein
VNPTSPHSNDTTSRAAALFADAAAPDRRVLLYAWLTGAFEPRALKGGTDAEMQAAFGIGSQVQSPRRWELVNLGLVEDSGQRRNTPAGHAAIVWRVVEPPPVGVFPRDPPPRSRSSIADRLEAARAEGYREGYAAGLRDAETQIALPFAGAAE